METAELRAVLETAGLSQYQAEAYVTLVELGTASAVELSNACEVPQARIYDVLRDLDEKGYVETYEHRSLHARAHDPVAVIEDLQAQASAALDAAEEIEARWQQPTVENHDVSVVNQFETVVRRAREYVADAEVEIQLSADVEQFRELDDDLADAHDRGVVVELLLYTATPGDVSLPDAVTAELPDCVTEARYRSFVSPFMLLVDRTSVAFAPETVFHPSNEYGMVINDYSLGHVFEEYFQSVLWTDRPVAYTERPTDPPAVYTRIRQCLHEILEPFEAGATIRIRVEGRDRTGSPVELGGTVVDLLYAGPSVEREAPHTRFADRATIVLDDGQDRYEIGGFGAILEDVEANRIVVESIET